MFKKHQSVTDLKKKEKKRLVFHHSLRNTKLEHAQIGFILFGTPYS